MAVPALTFLASNPENALPLLASLGRIGVSSTYVPMRGHNITFSLPQAIHVWNKSLIMTDFAIHSIHFGVATRLGLFRHPYLVRLRGDSLDEAQWPYSIVSRQFYSLGLKSAAGVICVSDYLAKKIASELRTTNIFSVHNGVDTRLFSPRNGDRVLFSRITSDNKERCNMIYVGRFSIPKKVEILRVLAMPLAEVFRKLDCALYVVGSGPELRSISEAFGSIGGIRFLGQIERPVLARIMPCFDIAFHPSGLDALPSAVMEASACGLPVLSTAIGGIPELVEHKRTGLLMSDPRRQLVEYLSALIEDASLRAKLGAAGRKKMEEEFNWRQIASEFLRVLDRIFPNQFSHAAVN